MKKTLLHCCCAPCAIFCIQSLENEGIQPHGFWYNPNIHPFQEYRARRECLVDYAAAIGMELLVREEYGLRDFVSHVAEDIPSRCGWCYACRLEETARQAAILGLPSFTTTLLVSPYQNHQRLLELGRKFGEKYGVVFLERDFRPGFRQGQTQAREQELYLQKYCGCVFSEEDRYQKQLLADKSRFA